MKTRAEIVNSSDNLSNLTEQELKEMFSEGKKFTGVVTRAEIFGHNLNVLLRQNKISRKVLADKLKITQAAIAMYINGSREPSLEKIFEIADFLKVSVTELIGDTEYNSVTPMTKKEIFEERWRHAQALLAYAKIFFEEPFGKNFILVEVPIFSNQVPTFSSDIKTKTYKVKDRLSFINIVEASEFQAARQEITFLEAFIKHFY